ncbi:MAG: hypothetical protein ACOX8I_09075 [Bacillota bacterium]
MLFSVFSDGLPDGPWIILVEITPDTGLIVTGITVSVTPATWVGETVG